jgi:hypothetical protein
MGEKIIFLIEPNAPWTRRNNTVGDLYRPTPYKVTNFHLYFQVFCIHYQQNLWLIGGQWLEHKGEFLFFSFTNLKNSLIFLTFLFLCFSAKFYKPRLYSYQCDCIQSNTSPSLKVKVP